MPNFKEYLRTLPPADHIEQISILDSAGHSVAVIENRPGQAGSVRIYAAVAMRNYGMLNKVSAAHALELYAEHVYDARSHPGQHPNIDRLFEIINKDLVYRVEILARKQ